MISPLAAAVTAAWMDVKQPPAPVVFTHRGAACVVRGGTPSNARTSVRPMALRKSPGQSPARARRGRRWKRMRTSLSLTANRAHSSAAGHGVRVSCRLFVIGPRSSAMIAGCRVAPAYQAPDLEPGVRVAVCRVVDLNVRNLRTLQEYLGARTANTCADAR